MTNFSFNQQDIVPSSLTIKASGSIDSDAEQDLNLPEGKTIGQLLNDEENQKRS